MTDVPVWRLFAYMEDDEAGAQDETRNLADWQVEDALRWCRFRGFDHIYLCRNSGETTRFKRADPVPVSHHMHLVKGSEDEPAGDAA